MVGIVVENNFLTKGEPALLAQKLSDCLAAGGSQAACQIAVQKEMNARSNGNKEALGLAMQSSDQGAAQALLDGKADDGEYAALRQAGVDPELINTSRDTGAITAQEWLNSCQGLSWSACANTKGNEQIGSGLGWLGLGVGTKTAGEVESGVKGAGNVILYTADDIRFSQNSVSFNKTDRVTGTNYTYNDLVKNMRENGWVGDPVDVVKMPDNKLTSMDNTRIAAAREAGIGVEASVRRYDESLTPAIKEARGWQNFNTWGDAITGRINKQSGGFSASNPYGSTELPRISGGD